MTIEASNLAQQINKAWMLRWNQKIDESLDALADIQLSANWESLTPDHLKVLPTKNGRENYIEVLLLKGSLLRAQGLLQKSSSWLRRVAIQNDEVLENRGFRLHFELGIDHWVHENTPDAMECFLLAEKKARTPAEKYFSYFNLLLCLEDLDLPRLHIEEKISAMIPLWRKSKDFGHLEEQWIAYQMRKKFFSEMKLLESNHLSGQAAFFSSWVKALPFFALNWKEQAILDLQQTYLWQGAYRSRTLTGVWLPADSESPLVADAITRLYLWTWWWMGDHPQIGTDKVIWTLESILRSFEMANQSKTNLLLLRNALSWIVLVEPGLEKKVTQVLKALRKISSSSYEFLEIEFALSQSLLQTATQKSSINLHKPIRRFPAFARILKESSRDVEESFLPRLQRRLRPFPEGQAKDYGLVIDLSKKEIRVLKSYRVMRSEALARLFSLVNQDGQASFEDILGAKSDLDPRKIYNLVVRARKLTSHAALQIRSRQVIRGPDWPQMMILNRDFDGDLSNQPTPVTKAPSLVESKTHLQVAKALLNQEFSRKDMQKILKTSKATACRMIEKWLQENWIEQTGKARTIRYRWKT
jgi:hypothetical protein